MTQAFAGWKVWQDSAVAGRFIDRRRGLLGSAAQVDTLLRLVAEVPSPQLAVLDLGCGDGFLLQAVMTAFPVRRAIALDGSPAMLEKAEVRFQDLGLLSSLVEFVEADFETPDWISRLPVRPLDAIISGFAIHHLEDPAKRRLYAEIFDLLTPGGVFVNVEHVASASALGERLFEDAYAASVAEYRRAHGDNVSLESVRKEYAERPDKAANRLAPVETQLQWLREIGFTDVDCYWKQFELAVMAGYRPREAAAAQREDRDGEKDSGSR